MAASMLTRRVASNGTEEPGRKQRGDQTLVGGSGRLFASRLVVAGLGWAGTVLIVRTLTPEEWGQFSFIFSLLGLLSVLSDLGIGRIVIAGLVRDRESGTDGRHLAGTYVALRFVLGLMAYVVALVFVVVADYPGEVVRGTAVAGLVLILATPSDGFDAVFQARRRLSVVALADSLGQVAQLAVTVALVTAGGTLVWLTVPAVAFEVVALAWKLGRLPADLRPRLSIDRGLWRRLLGEALPLAIGGIFATAFKRIDVVMLTKLDSFTAAGMYGIAYKFATVVHFVATAITMALLPLLVRAWPHRREAMRRTFSRALLLSAVAGGLILAEFVLFARPVIGLLYGAEYEAADLATKLVIAGEVAYFFTALAFTALIATGRHRQYPLVTAGGLIVNVLLNLWLIQLWSFEGAAVATVATEGAVAVVLMALALRIDGLGPLPLAHAARTVVAFASALVLGAAGTAIGLAWPVSATVTGVAFLGACHVMRVGGSGGLRALLREEPEADGAGVQVP